MNFESASSFIIEKLKNHLSAATKYDYCKAARKMNLSEFNYLVSLMFTTFKQSKMNKSCEALEVIARHNGFIDNADHLKRIREGNGFTYTFQNKFGTLVVEPYGEFENIADIHGKNLPDDVKFDLETAEKIVLITDNYKIQIGIVFPIAYMMVHVSPSVVQVVKIRSIEYVGGVPKEEIEQAIKFNRLIVP